MPRKNQHAVALGRKGGKARAAALTASERRDIASKAGRAKRRYRLTNGFLERRDGDRWIALEPPYDEAAKAFLRRTR